MPRQSRAKVRRVASSDEEEETVASSQATQPAASQRSSRASRNQNRTVRQSSQRTQQTNQSQFLSQFESTESQLSETTTSKRTGGRQISDEEVVKLGRNVAGFLLDWDERHKGPVSRALAIKHAVLPENQYHYKSILAEAHKQLTRLGAQLVFTSSNSIILEYNLPEVNFERTRVDEEEEVDELEDGMRDFLLGMILLHPEETVKEDDLKTLWLAAKLEGAHIFDEETTATKFDAFLKQHMLQRAYMERKVITNEETQVKESWLYWGPRAGAETTRLEALLNVCAVKGVDPTRCGNYECYVEEFQARFSEIDRGISRNWARELIAEISDDAARVSRED